MLKIMIVSASSIPNQFTDDLVPLMEFTSEQFSSATREVFSGSVSQTEEIIEKHTKVMDKLDKKKKVEINDIRMAKVSTLFRT